MSIRAYGWEGPWWDRPGFDMEALTVTGYTMREGGGKPALGEMYGPPDSSNAPRPAFPPTLVLND